jgi:16S rRNA (guanine966-N2)-methyltransferase
MRIVAGRYRSRELMTPSGTTTRPTTDRAREALFNVLTNMMDFHVANVLDLYAGSGALAFEAISRGAEHATLVENNNKAVDSIKKNAERLDVKDEIKLHSMDVFAYLSGTPKPYDLILVDAPYKDERALAEVPSLLPPWLAPGGIAVIEHRAGEAIVRPENSTLVRELTAGEAAFTIFTMPSES